MKFSNLHSLLQGVAVGPVGDGRAVARARRWATARHGAWRGTWRGVWRRSDGATDRALGGGPQLEGSIAAATAWGREK
jgi:hypothetical protein